MTTPLEPINYDETDYTVLKPEDEENEAGANRKNKSKPKKKKKAKGVSQLSLMPDESDDNFIE